MARENARRWITLASLAALLVTIGVWFAQGRVLFTVRAADLSPDDRALERLFEPTGVQDELGEVRGMDRGFRLGLLPSGVGSGLASVATIGVAVGAVWLISSARRPSGASRRGRSRRRACPSAADR